MVNKSIKKFLKANKKSKKNVNAFKKQKNKSMKSRKSAIRGGAILGRLGHWEGQQKSSRKFVQTEHRVKVRERDPLRPGKVIPGTGYFSHVFNPDPNDVEEMNANINSEGPFETDDGQEINKDSPAHPHHPMYKTYYLINKLDDNQIEDLFSSEHFKPNLKKQLIGVCKLIKENINPTIPYAESMSKHDENEMNLYMKTPLSQNTFIDEDHSYIGLFTTNLHNSNLVYEPDDLYAGLGGIGLNEEGGMIWTKSGKDSYRSNAVYLKCSVLIRFMINSFKLKLDHLTQIIFDYEKDPDNYDTDNKTLQASKDKVLDAYKEFIDHITIDKVKEPPVETPEDSEFPLISTFLNLDENTIVKEEDWKYGHALDIALCEYILTYELSLKPMPEEAHKLDLLKQDIKAECGEGRGNIFNKTKMFQNGKTNFNEWKTQKLKIKMDRNNDINKTNRQKDSTTNYLAIR